MDSRNRKFVVVTIEDYRGKKYTSLHEVSDEVLLRIHERVAEINSCENNREANDMILGDNFNDFFYNLLPETPDGLNDMRSIIEIKILAVIGEIKLI